MADAETCFDRFQRIVAEARRLNAEHGFDRPMPKVWDDDGKPRKQFVGIACNPHYLKNSWHLIQSAPGLTFQRVWLDPMNKAGGGVSFENYDDARSYMERVNDALLGVSHG